MPPRAGTLAIWDADENGPALVEATVGDLVDRGARLYGDAPALVYDDPQLGVELRLDYRGLRDEARRLAKGLMALGIERGEHVAVWAPNLPEWVLLELALGMIGAVLVTVNPLFRSAELRYVIEQGQVTTLFLWPGGPDRAPIAALAELPSGLLRRQPILMRGRAEGLGAFADVLARGDGISDAELDRRQAEVKPRDPAQIQYTSGTTGFPKGALLSHHGIINNAALVAERAEIGAGDRYLTAMPFFHTGGCVLGVLLAFWQGATFYPLVAFDPERYLRTVATHRITVGAGVPTMLSAMLNHPIFLAGKVDTSAWRLVITGGSPVPVALVEEFKHRTGADVGIVFGLTEASPVITQTLPADDAERKSATVGVPLAHTEVRIVRPGLAEPVAFGQPGELVARGYGIMLGYHNMPDRTAETIDDEGWLRSGDLATMDPRGYVNIVGRLKDMVIRGGENLYPAEIESMLVRHEAIGEAQVVGVPDERMGEELAAVVRLRPGASLEAETLRAWCRERMARHKVPRYVRFVDAFPLTPTGKVKKHELRAQVIEDLGLGHLLAVRTA
jgi:fatty-acyl-CoA synthase